MPRMKPPVKYETKQECLSAEKKIAKSFAKQLGPEWEPEFCKRAMLLKDYGWWLTWHLKCPGMVLSRGYDMKKQKWIWWASIYEKLDTGISKNESFGSFHVQGKPQDSPEEAVKSAVKLAAQKLLGKVFKIVSMLAERWLED